MDKQLKVTVTKDSSVQDNGMAEIYQSQKTKQALLRRESPTEFTRITNFVLCRDFLVDTYSFAKEKKDFGIYSFNFAGSKMQPDWTGVYIMMKFQDEASRERFFDNVEIIRAIERKNKYDQTKVLDIKGDDLNVVVVGDKAWLQNCLSFSLYSLLLRVACYKLNLKGDWIEEFGKQQASDAKYISSVPRKTLDRVFDDLSLLKTKEFCGFDPKKDGTGTIHHNSGFISVFGHHSEISESTVRMNKHWKDLTDSGLESRTKKAA